MGQGPISPASSPFRGTLGHDRRGRATESEPGLDVETSLVAIGSSVVKAGAPFITRVGLNDVGDGNAVELPAIRSLADSPIDLDPHVSFFVGTTAVASRP